MLADHERVERWHPASGGRCRGDEHEPLLKELLTTRDDLRHRILFKYPAYDYDIPCEIIVEPERRAIAIVAYTTHRLPKYRMREATVIASLSCPHDFPTVVVDEPTRRVLAIFPIAVQDIEMAPPLLDLVVASTVLRLLAVAGRIDLCADGLALETTAAIPQAELLRGLVPLRRYRPFRSSE